VCDLYLVLLVIVHILSSVFIVYACVTAVCNIGLLIYLLMQQDFSLLDIHHVHTLPTHATDNIVSF